MELFEKTSTKRHSPKPASSWPVNKKVLQKLYQASMDLRELNDLRNQQLCEKNLQLSKTNNENQEIGRALTELRTEIHKQNQALEEIGVMILEMDQKTAKNIQDTNQRLLEKNQAFENIIRLIGKISLLALFILPWAYAFALYLLLSR